MNKTTFQLSGKSYTLNYKGNSELLCNSELLYLGIVGSRSILSYTEDVLEDLFSNYLKHYNFCIVSGGMYGVDLFCHNLALKYGLKTIVVLPCGISNYEKSMLSTSLRGKDSSNLLLISEYDSNISPRKYFFLERNKLVVNLSKVLLVAQSSVKSGSTFSGNYSLKINKKTFCIPISLDKPNFQGNNHLISAGSLIYLDGNSVLKEFQLLNQHDSLPSKILDLIRKSPLSEEEMLLNIKGGVEPYLLEKTLLKMILEGSIFFDGCKYRL